MKKSVILSTGSYLPENIVENADLKQFPPNFLPLIEQKTGVKARRFAHESQCTSDLAIEAARRCLEKIQFDPLLIDAIILATSSPDRIQPATATRVQKEIGATRAYAYDINTVCSGGVYALQSGDALIRAGFCQYVLVLAAEIYSKFLDPADFSTYPYFGDGAGGVLLEARADTDRGVVLSILKTDGSGADIIQVKAGGTMLPYKDVKNPKDLYFKMVGREVYEFAVTKGMEIIREIMSEAGVGLEALRSIIAHQANINIISEISRQLQIDDNKFAITLDKYGNTAAASLFITLDELLESGQINHGDLILLVAFGGGLSWGANLIKY